MYKVLVVNLLKKDWSTGISNIIIKDLEDLNTNQDLALLSENEFKILTETGLLEFDNIVFISYEVTIEELKRVVEYNEETNEYYAERYGQDNFEQDFTNLEV